MTGEELRQWRRELGWTQPKAATELGVTLRGYQWCEKHGPRDSMALHAKRIVELIEFKKLIPEVLLEGEPTS